MTSPNRLKNVGFYFLLFFIVCFVLFSILEIFLRIYTGPFVMKIKGNEIILPRAGRTWTFKHTFKTDKLDELITIRQNSLGFRGEEFPENFSNKLTIIAVGGSTTYNAEISDGRTWIDILGRKLKSDFKDVWINNAGFNGASTESHILLMEQHISRMKPKIVLFLIGKNDSVQYETIGIDIGGDPAHIEQIKKNTSEFFIQSAYQRKKEAYSIKFKLTNLFKKASRQAAKYSEVVSLAITIHRNIKAFNQGLVFGVTQIENSETIEISEKEKKIIQGRLQSRKVRDFLMAYKSRVRKLIELSRDNNIDPVLITQPALYGNAIDDVTGFNWSKVKMSNGIILDGEHWWQWQELVNDITRKVAKDENVLLVDLGRSLPKSSKYYIDLIHYSNKGNEVVADIIHEKLCPYLAEKYNAYLAGGCNVIQNKQK